jgi:uncharacterized protein
MNRKHQLGIVAALLILVPRLALAAPAHPGWERAATDLQASWQRQHPGEKMISIQQVPALQFGSQGDRLEITYPFEIKIQRSGGEQLLRVGATYRSTKSAPYVFAGIDESVNEGMARTAKAVPLLDRKDARLMRALKAGDLAETEAALAAGANPQALDAEEGLHALVWAARSGNVKLVRLLLDKGVGVDARAQDNGVTALMGAVAAPGHGEVVQLLLGRGADVQAKNVRGSTALMMAGTLPVAKLLLDKGADANAKDDQGQTALMLAKDVAIAKLLLGKGADVNAKDQGGESALLRAAAGGNRDMVKLLLDRRAGIEAADGAGRTALMAAVEAGHQEIVGLLLGKKADVNAKDRAGQTALMIAAKNGAADMAKLLLGKGADVNVKDGRGRTALMAAAERGDLPTVQLLVERGADVRVKDPQGRTAMNLAAERGGFAVIPTLREKEERGSAQASPPAPATTSSPSGTAAAGLDAQTCRDACALLTRYAFDDLAANACKMCRKLDDTYCESDFPWNDVPPCEAYDELRNCIYARFGYVFSKPKWQKQFGKLPWYKPDPAFTEAKLPPVAKANVQKLKELKATREGCE